MIKLLKELEENVETQTDEVWRVTIASDNSGELLLGETPIAIFNNKEELNIYVAALVESGKTLTMALIYEILMEVQK